MIKTIVSLVLLFSATLGNAQDTAAILGKAKFIDAATEEIKLALYRTKAMIQDVNYSDSLFNSFSLVGMSLWDSIKDQPEFKDMELTNVTFKIPVYENNGNPTGMKDAIGKVFQDPADFKKFWNFVYTRFELAKARIVEKNSRDRFIYWLYFAKIEEPIIIIQTPRGRLLLKFVKGNLFFVELV